MEPVRLEAVLRGYGAVFFEGINAWAANASPFMPFENLSLTSFETLLHNLYFFSTVAACLKLLLSPTVGPD